MKKLIAVFTVIFLTASLSPVYADDIMQSVLISVKERLDIPEEYTEFNSDIYSSNDETVYSFAWRLPEDSEEYGNLSVSADGNGLIRSFNIYDSRNERLYGRGKTIPKISENEAYDIAADCFARLNPGVYGEFTREEISLSFNRYSVLFIRRANGIKTDDRAYISIDSDTGDVTDFNMSYTKVEFFESLDGILDSDGAKNAFKNGKALEKRYCTFGGSKEAKIVYQLSDITLINAYTGERFKYPDGAFENTSRSADAESMKAGGAANVYDTAALTEKEISVLEEIDGLMKADEIEKKLREMPELGLDGTKAENIRLVKRSDGKYILNLSFSGDDTEFWTYTDAKSGQLLSFNGYRNSRGKSEPDDGFIQKYYPGYIDRTVLKDGRRVRVENGIEYPQDNIYALKDSETGLIDTFYLNFDEEVTFADPDGILREEDIYGIVFELAEPELKYVFSGKNAVPVYSLWFDYFAYIDAVSGKPLNYNGEVQTRRENAKYEYSDISGHYAENAINALASVSVGFEGDRFEPDSIITQMDFAALVSQCVYDYVIYKNGAYDKAETAKICIINGVVKKEEYYPDEPLSREKAVQILLKAMDYERFATIEGIFKTDYIDSDDIDPALFGYAAIASGLKIVRGCDGYFYPKANITRAQAAVMLYNYLNNK